MPCHRLPGIVMLRMIGSATDHQEEVATMLYHQEMLAVAEQHQRDLLRAEAMERLQKRSGDRKVNVRKQLSRLYSFVLTLIA